MSDTTTTQYMELVLPTPEVQTGPEYAENINQALTQVDSHDHSTGKGTPVTPAGLNINDDLEFNNNNATEVRSVRFQSQGSPISNNTDIGCTYVSGVDLYYNDVNGNQVRITQDGSLAGTPGSITNLAPPASVTYNSGNQTFIFQSTTATAANIDGGSFKIREVAANANAVTLSSPSSLAADYTLILPPSLPSTAATAKFLTLDGFGNIGDTRDVDNSTLQISGNNIQIKNLGVTYPKLAPSNYAISELLTGTYTSTTGFQYVEGSSAVITTSGRPVMLSLSGVAATSADGSYVSLVKNPSGGQISVILGVTTNINSPNLVANWGYQSLLTNNNIISVYPPLGLLGIDISSTASGTYTYRLVARSLVANTEISFNNLKLMALEL